MKSEYGKFLRWAKLNKIELYDYQKQFAKALFENRLISIPRQSGRNYGIELLGKFYKSNS